MLNTLRKIFYWFSPYVNVDERRVAAMFRRLHENEGSRTAKDVLMHYVQQNIALLNLWAEYKYKGYDYLTKATRRRLYENLAKIRADFETFTRDNPLELDTVMQQVGRLASNTVLARSQPEKLLFLASVMRYLQPSRGLYTYRSGSSFGRLLQDPTKGQLEGDCNQIVTLYLYLYSTKFNIRDLELTTYPGHVALHFQGVDIEATNASFTCYKRDDLRVAPVQEIVSINLLDTSDESFKRHKVPAENFLQAARAAYLTSSERKLAVENLKTAYNNAVVELLRDGRYDMALKYAQQSSSAKLVETVANNGAIYYMKKNDFVKARKFAGHAALSTELAKTINHNEAVHLYNSGGYLEAVAAFRRAGEEEMAKRCYERLFMKEQEAFRNTRTVEELKAYSGTVARMKDYAVKSGNAKLIEHANDLSRKLL